MELLQSGADNLTVQMSKKDFHQILSAFTAIRQGYSRVDPSILNMTKEEVVSLYDDLHDVMNDIPSPASGKPAIRAVP